MSMNWTEEQLAEYQLKSARWKNGVSVQEVKGKEVDPGPESDLQSRIEDWCRNNGYPFFHDRSRGKNAPGFPDLVIALRAGKTLWLELKSKTGTMEKEQHQWRLMLMHLGHVHHVIRSFKAFLRIVQKDLQ
jgi:hypothetical protein